jgi:hypothetical protein
MITINQTKTEYLKQIIDGNSEQNKCIELYVVFVIVKEDENSNCYKTKLSFYDTLQNARYEIILKIFQNSKENVALSKDILFNNKPLVLQNLTDYLTEKELFSYLSKTPINLIDKYMVFSTMDTDIYKHQQSVIKVSPVNNFDDWGVIDPVGNTYMDYIINVSVYGDKFKSEDYETTPQPTNVITREDMRNAIYSSREWQDEDWDDI